MDSSSKEIPNAVLFVNRWCCLYFILLLRHPFYVYFLTYFTFTCLLASQLGEGFAAQSGRNCCQPVTGFGHLSSVTLIIFPNYLLRFSSPAHMRFRQLCKLSLRMDLVWQILRMHHLAFVNDP